MYLGTLRAWIATMRPHLGWVAVVVAALGVLAAHAVWPGGLAGQATYLTYTVGGATLAMVAVRRLPTKSARPWRWAAYGLVSSAAADVYWAVDSLVSPPGPDVSVADVAWICSYGFLATAMFLLLRNTGDGARADVEGVVDTAVALVVSVLVLWPVVVAPVLDDGSVALVTRLTWASYPVLDAILLALVLRAVISRRASSAVGGLLVGGATCWLLADFGSNLLEGGTLVVVLLDFGWMVGAALLGLATWVAGKPGHPLAARPRGVAERLAPWRMAVAATPLLVPALLELWSENRGVDSAVMLVGGTIALAALVGVRTTLLLRTRDQAEERLRSSERHYRALAANSADAVLVLDRRGRITNESAHLAQLLGLPGESLVGMAAISAVCAADTLDATALHARALSAPGTVFESELRLKAGDGSEPWLAVRAVNLLNDADVRGVVVNFHDITARKAAEEELVHLAFHDSLTGLANRALFHDRVGHVLETGAGHTTAVVFLDLDYFKDVNDGHGHDAGDELLRAVAARLLRAARSGDTVARLGGDEFALLLEHSPDPGASAVALAERILQELTAPFTLTDGPVTVSASLGIAVPEPGTTPSALLRDADTAMYQAKAAGRARWVHYTHAMRTATLERLQLDHDLANALEADQLRVAYQPLVDLATGSIVGFEALLRWDHPTLGDIPPDRFIPLAEDNGLIIPIGRWVLDTACRTIAGWQREHGRRDLTIAVNISARQLASSDLVSHVEDALMASGLPAETLVLEMTETVVVADPETAAGWLRQLRRLGVRLAIDDFGTGYSSLSYLGRFPVDILKIDRSFVGSMTDAEEVPALVHGLFELGHTLQLEMVAEGIETPAQLRLLRAERCHLGQGFLFSPALNPREAGALLAVGGYPIALEPVWLEGVEASRDRLVIAGPSPGVTRHSRVTAVRPTATVKPD